MKKLATVIALFLPICGFGQTGMANPTQAKSGLEWGTAASPDAPLVVDQNSHIVVMEYEAWFGPKAVTFHGTAAKPKLQSADMIPVGGGYDSADPAIIAQHVQWLESMELDGAQIEVTNNVACIFNSEAFIKKYVKNCPPSFRIANQIIRDNTANLYSAWSSLGTALKLIPMMGGIDDNVLYKDTDGKNALQKEIEYFGERMCKFPNLNVIYEGRPLMIIYLGAAQDPNPADNPLWYRIRKFLDNHPEITSKYTIRMEAGYLDSQPGLWLNPNTPSGPIEINPKYGFWSVVDRLNPTCTGSLCPYYPTYNLAGPRVENFTVSIATAGQTGWGCPNPNAKPYCEDASLRFGDDHEYVTLEAFMKYARQLQPIFLIVDQFNEYVKPDEGFDANTIDDTEPTNLWGYSALSAVRQQVKLYRQSIVSDAP